MLIKIADGTIIDGSKRPAFKGDIAIKDDKIIAVGEVPSLEYDKIIDASGFTVTPGFIDTHSHSDLMALAKPELLPKVFQGITTDVLGQDGVSMAPLPIEYIDKWRINIAGMDGTSDEIDWTYKDTDGYLKAIEKTHTTINTSYLIPHGNVRMEAMGLEDRQPTKEELKKMQDIVEREMKAGALGLSSGLIYIPCAYGKTVELIEMCKVVAKYDGVFVVHQRSEADTIIDSAKEIIEIGRQSGVKVHFSHFKVAGKNNWKYIDELLQIIEDAQAEGIKVSFDEYPYVAGSTTMGVVVPPWAHDGGTDKLLERLKSKEERAKMKYDMEHGIPGWDNFVDFAGFDKIYVTDVLTDKNKSAIGKSLEEYAKMQNKDVFESTFDLLLEEKNCVSIIDFYGLEEHIDRFVQRDEMNLCTDGMICNDKPHPRAYGAFARFIEKYVKEKNILTLEQAVYKMTYRAALSLGINRRGLLKEGYYADINILDIDNLKEMGTYTDPAQYPVGFNKVMVNGQIVVDDGKYMNNYPGYVIRKNSHDAYPVKWIKNNMPSNDNLVLTDYINENYANVALDFHKTVKGYEKTPLYTLDALAKTLGLGKIYVKDESKRFGLNAFKVLGAGFAMAKYLAKKLGKDVSQVTYEELVSEDTKKKLGDITFYSATDGNHGRAVAWFASKLGQKARIYMPKGSSVTRLNNILATGAYAEITDMNYDDTVRFVSGLAKENGGVMVQDTAWEGYEEIPVWIMQGYSAMAVEIMEDLKEIPTHIFIQAGVGSFASAIQGYFTAVYKEKAPIVTIFESDVADCYYSSALAGDGRARFVSGDMQTLMAGLACGEPNTVSFEIIKNYSAFFASCDDYVSALGMRILGNPKGNDHKIISGESGAGTSGMLYTIMKDPKYYDFKEALGLNEDSRVLLISSEGDTDPERYYRIVWEGKNNISEV